MKETSKVSHELASSTSRQASNTTTEGDPRRAAEENAAQLSGAATKLPRRIAAQDGLRSPKHSCPRAPPWPSRPSPLHARPRPLASQLSVSPRSKGKRNSGSRRAGAWGACARAQKTRGRLLGIPASSSDPVTPGYSVFFMCSFKIGNDHSCCDVCSGSW